MSLKQEIMAIVASRGYGRWYQEDAWNYLVDQPLDLYRLFTYLDERYPKINS